MVENDTASAARSKLYMEHFKNKDARSVYRRFRERGRMASFKPIIDPARNSSGGCQVCFQLMETDDRLLLDQWMVNWEDLMDFEVHSVMASKEAVERIAPWL